jgi:hypothetical protein
MAHMLFLGPELNRFALQMDYILGGIALRRVFRKLGQT